MEQQKQRGGRPPNDNEVVIVAIAEGLGPLQPMVITKESYTSFQNRIDEEDGLSPTDTYVLDGPIQGGGRKERFILSGLIGVCVNYGTGITPANG